jgi:hypothetical protein
VGSSAVTRSGDPQLAIRLGAVRVPSQLTVLISLTREPSVTTNVDVASEEAASEADDDHTFNHIPPPARPE